MRPSNTSAPRLNATIPAVRSVTKIASFAAAPITLAKQLRGLRDAFVRFVAAVMSRAFTMNP